MSGEYALFGDEYSLETLRRLIEERKLGRPKLIVCSEKRPEALRVAGSLAAAWGADCMQQPDRKSEKYKAFLEQVHLLDLKLGLCYSYDRIIPQEVTDGFQDGIYNVHGALLPKNRGANALNWVLINGETKTGVTIHKMSAKTDTGPIALQYEVEIEFTDTALSLREKLNRLATEMIEEFFQLYEDGKLKLREQDEKEATRLKRRTPQDGYFEWSQDTIKIYNLIRGLVKPWPGAWYIEQGEKHVINQFIPYQDVEKMRRRYTCQTKEK